MNNERYSRVQADEVDRGDEQEAPDVDEIQELQNAATAQFAWRTSPAFQPLQQHEDDDLTTPRSSVPPAAASSITPVLSPETSLQEMSNSWDDDDEDDDEKDLKRYRLDFSDTAVERSLRVSTALEDSVERGQLSLDIILQTIRQTRQEVKRRRMEQLLSTNRDTERLWIQSKSYCDLYDQGCGVLAVTATVWIVVTVLLHKHVALVLGILFVLARLAAKPLYWYIWGRHVQRKRQVTMELFKERNHVNQSGIELSTNTTPYKDDANGDSEIRIEEESSPQNGSNGANLESSSSSDDREMV